MSLNLTKKSKKNIYQTTRQYKTPKSFRMTQNELDVFEKFKEKLKDITMSDVCSDTQAMKVLLQISKIVSEKDLKKALSFLL